MKVFLLTTFALIAFAFNSILCRLALGTKLIDASSFTAIRLLSGAVTLLIIFSIFSKNKKEDLKRGNWLSAFFLFGYAICFSFAYIGLTTATGALILFGLVQSTMIIVALVSGERPKIAEWLGLALALGGLIYLVFPGLAAPPLLNSILMALAGVAWGFYTLRGRGSEDPLADTAGNFVRTIPFIALACLPFLYQIDVSPKGLLFAVLSGAIASGIGYTVWYAALKHHTATRAAILQLSVPVIAAIGGLIFLSEAISLRLIMASSLILGGIALVIIGRKSIKSFQSEQ
ncbi:MAG: DMT family transporter [Acidobacteria bacterium]|nr:DMT family transporter [Acidobacteriota bacterium]